MSPQGAAPGRRGPRTGEDTRGAILDAARAEFARAGYESTSLRGVARTAGVDPALVHHYFDGKADLFAQAVVQLSFPGAPHRFVDAVLDGPVDRVGARGVQTFLLLWEDQGEAFVALIRSAAGSEEVARGLREFLAREVFGRVARGVDPGAADDEVALRGGLAAAQMMGLAMARYVVRVPGVVDASADDLVERVGPVLQGYLRPV